MKNLRLIKAFAILLTIIFLTSIFSGCLTKNSSNYHPKLYENISPIDINAPETAFFDETIEFDVALDRSDYKVSSYRWDFQDGTDSIGKNVKHKYNFENEFEIEYPAIYTVTLFTTFRDNSIVATKHHIKLYPKEFTFYLNKNELSKNKPDFDYEKLTDDLFLLNEQKELVYHLDERVFLDECRWDLTLNIKKPLLLKLKDIKVAFYNEKGTKIDEKQFDGISNIGIKNSIKISGNIDKECEIKTLKILISSFSFMDNIKMIYGGENPSNICFRFI